MIKNKKMYLINKLFRITSEYLHLLVYRFIDYRYIWITVSCANVNTTY